MSQEKNTARTTNTKYRDSSSKIIFEDPTLCAQFLRGYLDIPLLQDVQPEDIEDVTSRYVHLFTEERNSDVVKRVNIKKTPFYLISLIEHKSNVDYNVVMQVFRYMVFIWEDYEKEMEKRQPGISKTRNFKYPPILPIVFYDGRTNWSAPVRLHDRVLFSDVLGEYIPNYRCALVQLREYSNADLMKREDVLSVVMMMMNLHRSSDFARIESEVSREYLQKVLQDVPEYMLTIISQIAGALLAEINVPDDEIEKFSERIKERHMGRLFADFDPYDVQATRKKAREEGLAEGRAAGHAEGRAEEQEQGIEKLVKAIKKLGFTIEAASGQLSEQYGLDEQTAFEKATLYW